MREAAVPQNRHQHPTCWQYVQDICNTCSFLLTVPQWFTILHRPAVWAKRGTFFGKWIIVHCMEGNNLCFVWADFFFFCCCISPPFPAFNPGEKEVEYMILVRWSDLVLNSSHQLGLLQQLKLTDPRALCAMVGLSKMPYDTNIHWFMIVWRPSQCWALLRDSRPMHLRTTNMLKYLFARLYR